MESRIPSSTIGQGTTQDMIYALTPSKQQPQESHFGIPERVIFQVGLIAKVKDPDISARECFLTSSLVGLHFFQ